MRDTDLPRHLARDPLAALYLVYGEEALHTLEAADALRKAARAAGFLEREVLTVEPQFKWQQLEQATQSGSLFSSQRLLELHMLQGKPGNEGAAVLERLAAACRGKADALLWLIRCPALDKTQQRSKWFTALEQAGKVVHCPAVGPRELPGWITARLAAQQQSLAPDALDWFTARCEGNLLAARQEIEKLALLHPPGLLALESLQAEVAQVARYSVWSLGESLVAGDATRYLNILNGLAAEGESAYLALWAIAGEIRALLAVGLARAQRKPLDMLYRTYRIWGEKQKSYPAALDRLKAAQLRAALAQAAAIDRTIKGVPYATDSMEEPWIQLQRLGLALMQHPGLSGV